MVAATAQPFHFGWALIAALVVTVAMGIWSVRRRRQRAISSFERRRPKCDAEFLLACGIPLDPLRTKVAIAARQVIAELGKVRAANTIMPEDAVFDDLGALPFWDSLDWLHYVFCVERKAGVKIPEGVFEEMLRHDLKRDGCPTLLVRHLVRATALAAGT